MEILAVLSVVVLFVGLSGTVVFGVMASIIVPVRKKLSILKPLKPAYKNILLKHFPFYRLLGKEGKKDFERRLKYFLANKQFIPMKMPLVTGEMRVLVGACAVQITFGYKPLKLANFPTIVLYPERYHSTHTGKSHKGEVNPEGMIVLSWEDFLKGYSTPDDGVNLGLHEMAHALKLEDAILNNEYAFIDDESLKLWHRESRKQMKKIRKGEGKFLRRYAAANSEEFFAVCIEQFFEQPLEFREKLPSLYKALSGLLNQDPAKYYRMPITKAFKESPE